MDNNQQLQQALSRLNHNQYQKGYDELIAHQKQNTMSFDLYLAKIKLEEKLNKNEQALKTCNFLLFMVPNHQELHFIKLQLLKKLQLFKEISDQLLIIKQLFPEVNLMQI